MLSTNNLKIIVHDVFEEMKEEIDAQYKEKVWSSLDEDLKLKIRETLKNGLIASDMQVNYSYHKQLQGTLCVSPYAAFLGTQRKRTEQTVEGILCTAKNDSTDQRGC